MIGPIVAVISVVVILVGIVRGLASIVRVVNHGERRR